MEGVKNWEKLTWQEKREERFKRWLNPPGVKFVSQAAEKLYRERAARFIKAMFFSKYLGGMDRGRRPWASSWLQRSFLSSTGGPIRISSDRSFRS